MDQTTFFATKQSPEPLESNKTILFLRSFGLVAKRSLDIFVSFLGLLLLSGLFLLIGVLIKRDSPGPVFFKGLRLGKNGRTFQMLKFRTMYETPVSYSGPRITAKEDNRITPFGSWLRDTKINELPQLWNVLIGDMSLVGPRPEDVIVGNDWDEEARKEVLSIRPGITSPASILYHDEELLLTKSNLMEDYFKNILPDKIRLDRLYVRNRSFGSDLDIIFWTLVIIIPRMFEEKIPEGYLFSGSFTKLINRFSSWFLLDAITSMLGIFIVSLLWGTVYPVIWGWTTLIVLAIIPAFVYSGLNTVLGLNRIEWSSATINDALALALTCWSFTVILWLSNYLTAILHWLPFQPLPTNMILIIGFLAQIGFVITRLSWIILSALANIWINWRRKILDIGERVLIVGAGKNFSTTKWLLNQEEFQYIFRIIGVVDDNIPSKYGTRLNGCLVLGGFADLPKIVKEEKIGVIIFTSLKIPQKIKEYADNLKKDSTVRLVFVDHLANTINQELNSSALSTERSAWSEDYHKFLAVHDNVTGLPNWILFQDHLCHALALAKRTKIQPKVMFVDLDLFIGCNVLEQKTWFEILRKVTDRLLKMKRESDTLFFLGIHGFAFIFDNNPDENSICLIADRIVASLTQPIICNNQTFILDTKVYISTEFENANNVTETSQEEIFLDYLISHRKIVRKTNE